MTAPGATGPLAGFMVEASPAGTSGCEGVTAVARTAPGEVPCLRRKARLNASSDW